MPDPGFAKHWHGILREQIDWHPTVNETACIGCGTCVTGCGRLVYRFDFERKKPVQHRYFQAVMQARHVHPVLLGEQQRVAIARRLPTLRR